VRERERERERESRRCTPFHGVSDLEVTNPMREFRPRANSARTNDKKWSSVAGLKNTPFKFVGR